MTDRHAGGNAAPRPASMRRRDFLLLRRRGPERVLEVSCERLYMRWADARSQTGGGLADTGTPAAADGSAEPGSILQPWDGEPAAEFESAGPEELFDQLERALAGVETLRLLDRQWLDDAAFAWELEARVDAFRAGGGSVE